MPPHQTDLTAETERDAAAFGVDLSTAWKEAQAAARPDAPVAAPRDALSEKQAAGPPAAPTWTIIRLIGRWWRTYQDWRECEGVRASLSDMSERELTDIGITRAEIDFIAAHRTLDRLKDDVLMMSRGVM
ncbi:hypothetical protein SSBR45G_12950 [Bradyrhizobium sp. SSBR45G]|uniref:DUF1127 domain-containing protein n=1 Tax=unclassified Bradyrhizobium TaxID=2631580 RepID=UPI0023429867|nr:MULTISPECIES: DUF1127 domain-containing protein [unclassified Bradyrhizobium]GLH76387.1 hypothetical protein SSBR45G_12950 [Bradyrhizobium sp. SSBR45G]GLH83129.1 hypothetical protein SSBR45R_05890 [Bradyrhizobium sp. SSBR45R]